jgi:chromate transporter
MEGGWQMILLKLFLFFFKLGLFSFGGGYVMIPLIQKEVELNGWLQAKEFADVVAISQMTPGPLAVNAATYIGAKVAGIWGSFFATLGVSLPSFFIIITIAKILIKFKTSKDVESVLKGIRPVTIGLMASAVVFFAEMSVLKNELEFNLIYSGRLREFIGTLGFNWGCLLLFALIYFLTKKYKIHPILAVVLSAALGLVLV